jgi:hypothetical protein
MYRSPEDKELRKGEVAKAYHDIMGREDLTEKDRQFMLEALMDVVAADNEDEDVMGK